MEHAAMPGLTFVIPVRHQANARNWGRLKSNLSQTVRSVAAQTDSDWEGFVVANDGADLPVLPRRFSVIYVNYPPNLLHDMDSADRESVYQAFRLDKGRRVLAGLVAAKPKGHVMIVDDDDFVSRRLADHVAHHSSQNGWSIDKGYVWSDGGQLLYRHDDFSNICGTSHIVRADLYEIPASVEAASEGYVRCMLGSHVAIGPHLRARGTPLEALPFRGAVYRIGHEGAHSKSKSLVETFIFPAIRHGVRAIVRNSLSLGYLSAGLRQEFFGTDTP
jgi:hypothetical protein